MHVEAAKTAPRSAAVMATASLALAIEQLLFQCVEFHSSRL
jgi:hypothetical protein